MDDEGGDAACWAHLVEEQAGVEAVDLAGLTGEVGLRWAARGEELNVNLLVFGNGDGVQEHMNHEVEVLLVGISGEGVAIVDGREHALEAGRVLLIPKGARRGTRATAERFAYLTCHRKRGGLMPSVR